MSLTPKIHKALASLFLDGTMSTCFLDMLDIPYKKNIGEKLNLVIWRIKIKSTIVYLANIFCTLSTQNLPHDPSVAVVQV